MADSNEKPVSKKRVVMLAGDAERRRLIDEHPEAILVSENLPLRANLSVLENITVVLQFRTNTYIAEANDTASKLLTQAGNAPCADQRDPDHTYTSRIVATHLSAM